LQTKIVVEVPYTIAAEERGMMHSALRQNYAWARLDRLTWLVTAALALGIAGCESTMKSGDTLPSRVVSQPKLPPTLGATFEVAHFQTSWDITHVVVDPSGLAHVIIGIKKTREVQHVLVGPDGVLGRETVATGIKPGNLDAAFDASGELHILVNFEHYAKVDGAWRGAVRTPWQEVGLEARSRGFVAGGRDLIWKFLVAGDEVGAPGHWDLIVLGNVIGVPWHSPGWKLMVVPETTPAYSSWTVIDPHDNLVVDGNWISSDADGVVTLLYQARGYGLRYARFDTGVGPAEAAGVVRTKGGRILRSITATPSTRGGQEALLNSVAAAPDGATRLFVQYDGASRLVHGDTWGVPIARPIAHLYKVLLASAGGEGFHALAIGTSRHVWSGRDVPLYYMQFSDGGWSDPVELGIAPSLGFPVDAINIGSAAGNKALAVWPTDSGIVGRWITLEAKSPQ
jgi:hypothetical protein